MHDPSSTAVDGCMAVQGRVAESDPVEEPDEKEEAVRLHSGPQALLPADAYHDHAWFEAEQVNLFANTWHVAGSVEELGAPGDVATVTAGTDPIFVVRADDGELHAFHNLCPHRGYKLVANDCAVGQSITCGYHFWNFRLSGELRNVPQGDTQFADLDKSLWGLRPAAVAEWEGLVLVHPDPGETLAGWLGEFPSTLGSHHPGRLAQVAHVRYEAACNWKLFVENHIDVYHLWYLHARTLDRSDHDRFEWQQVGPHWASYEPLKKEAYSARRDGLPPIPGLDERDRQGVLANLLFPNVMLAATNEVFLSYVAEPVSATRTVIDLRIRARAGCDVDRAIAESRPFLLEDIRAAERVQEGARSSRFAVGPLGADDEKPIELFHQHYLSRLGEAGKRLVADVVGHDLAGVAS